MKCLNFLLKLLLGIVVVDVAVPKETHKRRLDWSVSLVYYERELVLQQPNMSPRRVKKTQSYRKRPYLYTARTRAQRSVLLEDQSLN